MRNRGTTNGEAALLASSAQLWRANSLGILGLRREPGAPLDRQLVKELLAELAAQGLWQPTTRAGKA